MSTYAKRSNRSNCQDDDWVVDRHPCGNSTPENLDRTFKLVCKDFRAVATMVWGAEKSMREIGYRFAAIAYRLAQELATNDKLWSKFRQDRFWEDRTLDRKECLRHSMIFMCGEPRGPLADRARDHARALAGVWKQGKKAAQVFELLKKHHFDGLKAKPKSKQDADDTPKRMKTLRFSQDVWKDVQEMVVGDQAKFSVRVRRLKRGDPVLFVTNVRVHRGDQRRNIKPQRSVSVTRSPALRNCQQKEPRGRRRYRVN